MIFGEGPITKRFIEYNIKSNISLITDETTWEDNFKQKILHNKNKRTVYFSNLLSENIKNEEFIRNNCNNYLIVKVPELIVSEYGLVNRLVEKINEGKKELITLSSEVNLLDIDDLFFIVHKQLKNKSLKNKTIIVSNNNNISTQTLIKEIETYLEKTSHLQPNFQQNDHSSKVNLDKQLFIEAGIPLSHNIRHSLKKHFFQLKNGRKKISIVVPTYFNEKGVDEFYRRTKTFLQSIQNRFEHEIIFINDGSTDSTFEKLCAIQKNDRDVKLINFSKNFGNQIAIAAGLDRASGDCVVIIDDDLQDPPEVILTFLAKWQEGFKVVYGVRKKREGVGFSFKLVAKIYYRLLDKLSETKIPVDTGDFRLIDKIVVENLRLMKEENLYYRGMVPWLGFSQFGWKYDRDAREFGSTTFTLTKYFKFALSGITSFSDRPLYFSSYFGFCITFLGLVFALYLIINQIAYPESTIRGWTSTVAMLLFFGGVQLLSIGILGIYLSKVYREVKRRPLYVINDEIGFKNYE